MNRTGAGHGTVPCPTYTYDNAGNILTASNGTTTNSYTYGNALWRDLLTAYNGNYIAYEGQTVSNGVVTGDVIGGNPISYYNGKRYSFTWEEGRNLVSAVQGTNTYTYAYDSSGLRVSKTVNGVKHEYLYASGRLLRETYGDVILDFVYDHNGHPFALNYTVDGTSTRYYYITNLQGDVLAMITGQGVVVASYSYDPYGKVLTATGEMADINPLRYRGYYYDTETEFYYLLSRYYDPAISRFVNADSTLLGGQGIVAFNLYSYCGNNPVNCDDPLGTFFGSNRNDKKGGRIVGVGVQIEGNVGNATMGYEIIVYWDVKECSEGKWVIAVYDYKGFSVSPEDPYIGAIIGIITDNAELFKLNPEGFSDELVLLIAALFSDGVSLNISAVGIYGDSTFNSVTSYEESFTSVNVACGRFRGSYAYSSNCRALALGGCVIGTPELPSWGISKTYYTLKGYWEFPAPF